MKEEVIKKDPVKMMMGGKERRSEGEEGRERKDPSIHGSIPVVVRGTKQVQRRKKSKRMRKKFSSLMTMITMSLPVKKLNQILNQSYLSVQELPRKFDLIPKVMTMKLLTMMLYVNGAPKAIILNG